MALDFFKQSDFSRTRGNDAKMGAFYTDLGMCRRMRNVLKFPEEEVCVLEPSIGDAEAVLEVTRDAPACKIFGVELNAETFEELQRKDKVDYLLNADFLEGVEITNSAFSFCFANPPYGQIQDTGERYEKKFLEKMVRYLSIDSVLVLVIPHYVLTEEKFLKFFFSRFAPYATYRFDDAVYAQFKQIVVFAKRRKTSGYLREWLDRYYETIREVEGLPYLPTEPIDEPLEVVPSSDAGIELFTTRQFDAAKAARALTGSTLYKQMEDYFIQPYEAIEIGHPPVPLSTSQAYLTAVSGGGQGLVGSAENRDKHLQRGVVKVVVEQNVTTDWDTGVQVLTESSHSVISLNVLENDGTITVLS